MRTGSGAVLIGPAGVGKTTLARAAAERLGPDFPRSTGSSATASGAAVPFAAFERLLDIPEHGQDRGGTAGRAGIARRRPPARRRRRTPAGHAVGRAGLPAGGQPRGAAARHRDRRRARCPTRSSALWRDGLLTRIDVEPAGHDDSRLTAQVDEFVETLPAAAHRLLEYLAVADPLPAGRRGGAGRARRASTKRCARGAVVVGRRRVAPGASVVRRRGTRRARRTGPAPAAHRVGRAALRVSRRRCRRAAAPGGAGDRTATARSRCADVCAAAQEALRLGDLELSERLGQAALGARTRPGHPAHRRIRAGVAGPRPRGRRGARRDRSGGADRRRADGVGVAHGGQPVLDAVRTGARDGVPAVHARQGVLPGGADDAGRAVCDVRDERGKPQPRKGHRRRGAGVADRRRHRDRLGGLGCRAELGTDGPLRRRRRAGRAGAVAQGIRACCASPVGSARRRRC